MEPDQLATRGRILPRAFYDRSTVEVARDLLGKVLASNNLACPADEHGENFCRLRLELEGGPIAAQFARAQVEFVVFEADDPAGVRARNQAEFPKGGPHNW